MPELTVTELAEICGASLDGDGSRVMTGPATLRGARPDQVAFLAHPKYRVELAETMAGAVVVGMEEERSIARLNGQPVALPRGYRDPGLESSP